MVSGKRVEEYRRQLGSFGISGDLALQQIASLSGGQKSRVAFARMCMTNPNFLVLDEPTNHLDIESIEALGKAIEKYTVSGQSNQEHTLLHIIGCLVYHFTFSSLQGGVILVSHDERLIRMVCKELWVCGNGNVKSIEGGFDEYKKIIEKEIEALNN